MVAAAGHLLSYNTRRIDKTLRTPAHRSDAAAEVAGPLAGAGPVAVRSAPAEGLAELATTVITAWQARGVDPAEIVVLARVNSTLLPVQVACMEAGLPSSAPLGVGVLARTGMRTAFAYLRIGSDPGRIRQEDVRDTIRRPSRGIAPMVVDMVTKRSTTSVADIRRLAGRLSGRDVPKLLAYADDLDAVATAAGRSTAAALEVIGDGIGLKGTMDVLDASRREADRSTHRDDLAALAAVAALHPDAATFEHWLRGVLTRPPAEGPAVLLSTVHRIKGKEWDRVIVFGATDGILPHRLGDDEEGERRIFHVALTRARQQVVILADTEAPSPFIEELDGSRPRTGRHQPAKGVPHPTRTGTAPGRRGRAQPTPAPGPPTVEAATGLSIEHRGQTGRVLEVGAGGVVVGIGEVRTELRFGTDVRVEGKTVSLVAPAARPAGAAETALRQWRSGVARQDGVPAYVVLNDKELVGIASVLPRTLTELASCRGIGPLRLERWGDEILAVLDGVDDA